MTVRLQLCWIRMSYRQDLAKWGISMGKVFILIAIFIVIVYVYLYRKMKTNKERTQNINSVRDFNNSYEHLSGRPKQIKANRFDQNSRYNNYVTKYNSSEDYREKR